MPDIWPRRYPDISANNGPVDIGAVVGAGVPVVAIKATEGTGYVNPLHHPQARLVHELYTGVVHYHFCRPSGRTSIWQEAAWFWAAVEPVWRPWDRLMLDLEVPATGAGQPGRSSQSFNYLRAFESALAHYQPNPVVAYTYAAYYVENELAGAMRSRHWCIADLGAPAGEAPITAPDELWAHQFTFTGRWPGITGAVDVNQMNSKIALQAELARTLRKRRRMT